MVIKWEKPTMKHGEPTKWGWIVLYPENLTLGENVDIGAFSLLQAKEGIIIEDDVQLGGGVKVYSVDSETGRRGRVVIEKGVCIGANSVIFPNTKIGAGALVGALSELPFGTVVQKNEIWKGSPAKKIGFIINGKRIYGN